jgi:predicted metal-binding protein
MNTKSFLDSRLKSKLPENSALIFGKGNSKLDERIATFSLPAGFSCPGALNCLSFANRKTGHIKDGESTEFRCFAASQECSFPNLRKQRWNNLEQLKGKSKQEMIDLINSCLPAEMVVRIHVAGDFFSQDYFDAWLEVARINPIKLFYAYTKSIPFWIARLSEIPKNLVLNASMGGQFDSLALIYKLKTAKVVFNPEQAKNENLEIDHDDYHAMTNHGDFALLLHGIQPAGSPASASLKRLKRAGFTGYNRDTKKTSRKAKSQSEKPEVKLTNI